MVLTVAVALLASFLVYIFLKDLQEGNADQADVVTAAVKISEGTRITREMVKTVRMPVQYIHPQAARRVDEVVGLYATVEMLAEEVILTGQLAATNTTKELTYRIPEGKRAVTVAVSSVTGVAGHIKPGHFVDMLVSYQLGEDDANPRQVTTLMQNIEVLAVGPDLQKKDGVQAAENITLAVSPQDAQRVMVAESQGQIKFSLRPAGDEKKETLKPVNLKGVMGTAGM